MQTKIKFMFEDCEPTYRNLYMGSKKFDTQSESQEIY